MDQIRIKPTEITPTVILDKSDGIFVIKGKCLPEDVKTFFAPVIEWVDQYVVQPNESTKFIIDFDYFNTASSKMILIILSKLRDLHKEGHSVEIVWKYPQYDLELEEAGEEFSELLNLPFEFIPKKE